MIKQYRMALKHRFLNFIVLYSYGYGPYFGTTRRLIWSTTTTTRASMKRFQLSSASELSIRKVFPQSWIFDTREDIGYVLKVFFYYYSYMIH
jgi:hypothetical protein